MRKNFFVFFMAFLSFSLYAQKVEKKVSFENTVIKSVVCDDGGNIFIGGKISIPGSMKITDGFVAKLDKDGNVLWQNYFGARLVDEIRDIAYKEGKIFAVGITWTKENRAQVWLVILFTDGKILSQHYFGNKLDDAAYKIISADDKSFFILGYTTAEEMKTRNLWIVKIDDEGNMLWNKQLGAVNEMDEAYSGVQLQDGLLILGRYWGMGVSDINPWIIKTDFNGNVLWDRKITLYEDNFFVSAITFSQQILLIGNTWEKTATHKGDLWFMSIDSHGRSVLDKRIGTSVREVCNKALLINDTVWVFGSFGREATAGIWKLSPGGEVISQNNLQLPQINDALLLEKDKVVIVGGKASDGYMAIVDLGK